MPTPGDGAVDVAVVGGGVTGCACAHVLAGAGLRVRLHEAREIAGGASGRNGGFALRGGAPAYDLARRGLGADRAEALWQLTERYLERLEGLAGDAFRRTGSLRLAADRAERAELDAEHEALREDGFAVEWRDELDEPLAGRFHGAIFHPTDGSLQPARWVRRLAARAADAGAELCEHSRIESLDDLAADQVVVATDGYTAGLVPALDAAVTPARGQVVVTEPLDRSLFPCPHYARHGYDYWQQIPDGRVVAGGFRDKSFETETTTEEATTPSSRVTWSAFSMTSWVRLHRSLIAGRGSSATRKIGFRWPAACPAETVCGSRSATRVTGTSWGSPVASSSRTPFSAGRRPSSSCSTRRGSSPPRLRAMTLECAFCEIVAGRRDQEVVASTGRIVAFLCEPPATQGHTLIVPRRHRGDIWDIEPAELAESAELARRLARVMRERLGAVGINVRQNSGARAGQDVPHFHVHVVPRYDGDTVQPGCVWGASPWEPPPNGKAERRRISDALRSGLAEN